MTICGTDSGTLLVEARDPEEPEDGTIAHCVFRIEPDHTDLLEMEVAYAYRGNRIMQALLRLSSKIMKRPHVELPDAAFKYL